MCTLLAITPREKKTKVGRSIKPSEDIFIIFRRKGIYFHRISSGGCYFIDYYNICG